MISAVEARCIVCHLMFCCADCRWKHEQNTHGIQYDCHICRGFQFLCKPEDLSLPFLQHLSEEHLPLQCKKCNQIFSKMEDLIDIDKCNSISELIKEDITQEVEEFDCLYEKVIKNGQDDAVLANKNNKTAIVTPVVRKKHLVDYGSSESDEEKFDDLNNAQKEIVTKRPKLGRQKSGTPHVKKLLSMIRQKKFEESEDRNERDNGTCSPKTTPSRKEKDTFPATQSEMTTPTSQIPNLLKLAQLVTTSTPTNPVAAGWSMFPEQGTESPLSEIENADSPAQSIDVEPSKSESEAVPVKLKSIILTGSRIRIAGQDSTEKHVTFQDSPTDVSMKKKVTFAEDTVFNQQPKVKRVYRKPKRMLTPGPQRPKFCYNPRFQALINRFENQGMTVARTPVQCREEPQETTPPVGDPGNMQARAIEFGEESPVLDNYNKDDDDSYKTCIESPVSNALSALTANLAGSLQTCLHSALITTEENTEIQFKFVITKKKFSVRKDGGEGIEEKITEVEANVDKNKDNVWSTVAKAVKNVFWGETGSCFASVTPHRTLDSNASSSSSASKRKIEDLSESEDSPINHKRFRYGERIRGRPPLRRFTPYPVTVLRTSQSAEQQRLIENLQDDTMNSSF